jgi:hypothetical protein
VRWRLDHSRHALDAPSVLILDEAGMTDDRDLRAALTLARGAPAPRGVLVGDDRQLGPVRPRRGPQRHPRTGGGSAHGHGESLRRADPAERAALDQRRSGASSLAVRPADDRPADVS